MGPGSDPRAHLHSQEDAVTKTHELMTPAEVARLFRVDPKTVSRWAQEGKLPHVRTLGGHRRYPRVDVLRLYGEGDDALAE